MNESLKKIDGAPDGYGAHLANWRLFFSFSTFLYKVTGGANWNFSFNINGWNLHWEMYAENTMLLTGYLLSSTFNMVIYLLKYLLID